jgi:hypothetical protein
MCHNYQLESFRKELETKLNEMETMYEKRKEQATEAGEFKFVVSAVYGNG